MQKTPNWVAILLITMGLTACSSSPIEVHYYTLFTTPKTNKSIDAENIEKRVQVSRIRLADYMQQGSLVMQTDEHKLIFSRQHQWAEKLQSSIEKSLLNSLNQASDAVVYVGPREPKSAKNDFELVLHIEHLVPTTDAEVISSGQFWLRDGASKKIVKQERFYMTETLEVDGYQHAVSKMRILIDRLAKNIHQQL